MAHTSETGAAGGAAPRHGDRGAPQTHGPVAQPPGMAPKPHGQREAATPLAELGQATPRLSEAGDVALMALQSDLTARNIAPVPDTQRTQAEAGQRQEQEQGSKRANGRAGSIPNQGRQTQTQRLWLAVLWCREPRRGALHSYQLFTKHQRNPRELHRFSGEVGFPQPSRQRR